MADRATKPEPTPEGDPGDGLPVPVTEALAETAESSGDLLTEVGDGRGDTLRHQGKVWARHIRSNGAPASASVDWDALRTFLADAHLLEHGVLSRLIHDNRSAFQDVIKQVMHSISADRSSDDNVQQSLASLDDAIKSGSPAMMKKRAQKAVAVIGKTIEERRVRQEAQVKELNAHLAHLRGELDVVRQQNLRDALTGVLNRRGFDTALERATTSNVPSCLFMIDADHFKQINDTHGHPGGDAALKALAGCLSQSLRGDDVVARYGGEEFGALASVQSREAGFELAKRILANVRALEIVHNGKRIHVTVSIGVSLMKAGDTPKTWLDRADKALYEAKQAGRDRAMIG